MWARAGLDRADEAQSLAFSEELFADVLRGRRLLSNRSIWLQFAEVSNATWRVGNLVLVGDAAHTAHFSIGSGTKLAMEDSSRWPTRWRATATSPRAAADYELERKPVVERLQEAARQSARYFEQVPRGARAAAVRVQPDHALGADRPREPDHARPAADAGAGRLVRARAARAAAAVRAAAPARAGAAQPRRRGGARRARGGRAHGRRARAHPADRRDARRAGSRPTRRRCDDDWDLGGARVCALLTHAGAPGRRARRRRSASTCR